MHTIHFNAQNYKYIDGDTMRRLRVIKNSSTATGSRIARL